jgi:hypothetical protein
VVRGEGEIVKIQGREWCVRCGEFNLSLLYWGQVLSVGAYTKPLSQFSKHLSPCFLYPPPPRPRRQDTPGGGG